MVCSPRVWDNVGMSLINRKVTIQFDIATAARTVFLVVGLLLFIQLLGKLAPTIVLVVVSAFLAIALNPAVSKISAKLPSRSRTMATATAFILVVSFLGLFFSITLPPIVDQVTEFASDLPATVENFRRQDNFLSNLVERYDLDGEISEAARTIATRVAGSENGIIGTVGRLTSTVVNTIAVLIMTFMMLVEGPTIIKKLSHLTDPKKRKHRAHLANQMYEVITGYVNGQLLIATIAASVSLLAMLVLGIPNALAMAGIVGMMGLIPLIGASIAAAIVVLSTLLVSVNKAIFIGVFFLIYQQIENATIQPFIQGRKSELSALTVFIAALVGVNLGGLFGAFLAIPVAGILKVLADDYLANHHKHSKKSSKAKVA